MQRYPLLCVAYVRAFLLASADVVGAQRHLPVPPVAGIGPITHRVVAYRLPLF
jgi:hypothetical protein